MNKYKIIDKKAVITGVLIAIVSAVVYIAAYYYEQSYLIGSGVPASYANVASEVPLATYGKFLAGFLVAALVVTVPIAFLHSSKRFEKILRSKKQFWFSIFLLFIAVIIGQVVLHFYNTSPYAKYGIALEGFATLLFTVSSLLFIGYLVDAEDLSWQKVRTIKAHYLIKTLFIVAIFWYVHQQIVLTSGAIGKVVAAADRLDHPTVRIEGEEYLLIRDYGYKLVLLSKNREDFQTKILYTSDFHSLDVKWL